MATLHIFRFRPRHSTWLLPSRPLSISFKYLRSCQKLRVLKPGGVVYARIHLFTSPSGGHKIRVAEVPLRHVPKGVEPWDHLRKRRLPLDVPLNEWRQDQYLKEFGKHFDLLKHYCAMREGEELLPPASEAEHSIQRDELTCGADVIVGRKPL